MIALSKMERHLLCELPTSVFLPRRPRDMNSVVAEKRDAMDRLCALRLARKRLCTDIECGAIFYRIDLEITEAGRAERDRRRP